MPLKFTRLIVSSESYESAGVWDVDGDGIPDIVSGSFWYKGPDFRQRFYIGEVSRLGEYWNDFSTIPMAIAGSGRLDFVTGGWGGDFRWMECPEDPTKQWKAHSLGDIGYIETIRAADIDGDGIQELIPNTPHHPQQILKLVVGPDGKGTGKFERTFLTPQGTKSAHGLGYGDIAGSKRVDIVLRNGWLEAPARPFAEPWAFHQEFDLGMASVPIIVTDINGDGLADLIVGQAHNYGLDWYEQRRDAKGVRSWHKHPIDPECSQYHDMHWADIDGDGQKELVTGKRYRAHCGRDPGEFDDLGIYYFKWNGESFSKQVISHGPPSVGSGCGIHFALHDLRGTGRLDVIAPGKDGLHVFFNEGRL